MSLLPDDPNWAVRLSVVLSAIVFIICAFFREHVINVVFGVKYNWEAWKVLRYLQRWTKLRDGYVREIEKELRQVALNGEVTVWAVLDIAGPHCKINKEKFAEFTFDLRQATRRPDPTVTLPPQFIPKVYEEGHRDNFLHEEVYYDPWFNKGEIKRVWRRQWFRTLQYWIGSRRKTD